MSFQHNTGTRGRPRHPGLLKVVNALLKPVIRWRGGVLGVNMLVLTTVGAKSGQTRQTPLQTFPRPDGTWLVAASANGSRRNPAWFHNIIAHPDRLQVEAKGEQIHVRARQLHGQEREDAWAQIVAAAPNFAGYASGTDRVIPVLELSRA